MQEKSETNLPVHMCYQQTLTPRGGATILKVGGTISQAERAKKFFLTPHFQITWGVQK